MFFKTVVCSNVVLQEALRVGCKHRQRQSLPTSVSWHLPTSASGGKTITVPQSALPMPKPWKPGLVLVSGDQKTVVVRKKGSSRLFWGATRVAPAVSPNTSSLLICPWSWSWTFTASLKQEHHWVSLARTGLLLGVINWKFCKFREKLNVEHHLTH